MNSKMAILRGALILLVVLALLGWFFWRRVKRSADPSLLLFKGLLTLGVLLTATFTIDFAADDAIGQLGGLFHTVIYGTILAVIWRRNLAEIVGNQFANLYSGGTTPPKPEPVYSIAQAKKNRGKFRDAIYEIQAQLVKFPADLTGHMMMAEIQAEHLADVDGAQLTIERFCHQPKQTPQNLAYALNLLADLRLKHALDPDGAQKALEKIIELAPDTETAHQAAQRIAHLASQANLVAAHDRSPMELRAGEKDVGLKRHLPAPQKTDLDPEALAAEYIRRLEQHADDDDTREKLAVLYADHYQQLDLAAEQLEQLIQQPHARAKDRVHWLNLLADLQIRHGVGFEAVQETLRRIIDLNPLAATAENARQRLGHLKLEFKKNEKSQTLKLGSYEKDVGLKGR